MESSLSIWLTRSCGWSCALLRKFCSSSTSTWGTAPMSPSSWACESFPASFSGRPRKRWRSTIWANCGRPRKSLMFFSSIFWERERENKKRLRHRGWNLIKRKQTGETSETRILNDKNATEFKVSIRPTGFLLFWYLYNVSKGILEK